MSDLVSVIITSYNAGRYIDRCIRSVLGQTYSDLEIIIINDGSTDNTESITKGFEDKYEHVRYIFQPNSGVSVARNRGIAEAIGKYIMFVDGDDYIDNSIVERLVNGIDDSDIICCCCKAFTDQFECEDHFFGTSFNARTQDEKEKLFLQLLNGNLGKPDGKGYTAIGVPWGKLYRRDFLKDNKILFNPKLIRMQDNMFNMYAFYYSKNIVYINEPLYYYRLDHIQNQAISYGMEIWRPFLEAREQLWTSLNGLITPTIEMAKQYELNIAFISAVLNEIQNMRLRDSIERIGEIRNESVFSLLFREKMNQITPLRNKIFFGLAKYHLYFPLVICIKLYKLCC